MSSVRDLLAVGLLVVAAVLGGFWLPASWLHENVVEQDGFLAISQPLADDAQAQRSITDSAVEELLSDDRIPGWIESRLTPLAQEQAVGLTETEAYRIMWEATMVDLHAALFTPGVVDLTVDLSPAIDQILSAVEDKLPIELPRPDSPSVTLASIPDLPVLVTLARISPWAAWLGPAALALAVLAVVLAAHRRTVLTAAGLAGILAGAVTSLIAGQIDGIVPDSVDEADFIGPIVQVFEEQFTAALLPQGVILIGAGALIATAGLVAVGLHRRS